MKNAIPLAVALALTASAASAQTMLPSPSAAEASAPRPARAPGIATALAVEAAQTAVAACAAQGLRVTALVADSEAVPVAMISGDGAAAITQRIAAGKARTSVVYKMTSGEAVAKANADAAFKAQLAADPNIVVPRPGAVPIKMGEQIIGAIAVSGAPSGAVDEVCAKEGLATIDGRLKLASAVLAQGQMAGYGGSPNAKLDPAAVAVIVPKDVKWEYPDGYGRAMLFGDQTKPGPYAYLIRWEPGQNSQPHSHDQDRYAYVLTGSWWTSTASTPDKTTMVPVRAGSFVKRAANDVHWDGARDETTVILMTGNGPVKTTRVAGN